VVKKGIYDIYASEIVINEIQRADLEKRQKLMKEIDNYKPIQLETNDEMRRLAQAYMEAKIVPAKKVEDALHVAIATVSGLDAVISWNFDHLANLRKADLFNGVNLLHGYSKRIEIVTPMEVSRV
jgi:predicted nucleic acid-binding protein